MKTTRFLVLTSLLAACTSTPPPPPRPAPAAAPVPVPAVVRPANGLTPVAGVPKSIAEPRIRVGMLSDQTGVEFPRVEGGYYLITGDGASTLKRGFTLTPPLSDTTPHYAVQAGAISDTISANAFVEKLRRENPSLRIDMVFDPAAGANRIMAGDFATAGETNPLRDRLTAGGYGKDMMIVRRPADQPFEKRHRLLDDEGERATLDGESVLVLPASADTILIDKKPYRTAARVLINARGLYNVINELNMEDYLRGVVPGEMGPKTYDELEALKAQAVAARTYAVRNLGQYAREGYDICPGPLCQQYSGFIAEDPLTDQAVKETAGLVMTFDGKPIDALYTATCGGETSDVGTMFPGRNEPYLKRARCVELEMVTLTGHADSGVLTEPQMNGRVFAAVAGLSDQGSWSARDVELAVSAATTMVRFDARSTVPPPPATPTPPRTGEASRPFGVTAPAPAAAAVQQIPLHAVSSRRGDVLTYLAAVFGFDRYASVVTVPEDRRYFFPQTSDVDATPYRAAAFLIKYGFIPSQEIDRIDLNAAMPRDELYSLLGSWLRKHNALTESTGKILKVAGRDITLKAEGKTSSFTLPVGTPIYRRLGDRFQEYASAPVMIGDRAVVLSNARKTPVALVVQANYDGASFDRTSSFANWTRSFRADELVASISRRNPIRQLAGIRPLVIDPSQRIAEMEVTAEEGRTFVLKGLPVRWSLGVPDNLFVYEKSVDPDGADRYTFYGKGWGHGTGLCQVGAYGMAFRGFTYDQILKRYYAGIEIVKAR